MDINGVLSQMRTLAAQAQTSPQANEIAQDDKLDFSSVLKNSLNQVNGVLTESGKLAEAFDAGDPNVDLAQVMVSLQKASVSFQAMTQVRNKLVSAYQDIMNMPI